MSEKSDILSTTIGSILDYGAQYFGAKQKEEYNKEAAERQQQWNIEQWERQNKYNHPQEQMARLREAGLNPQLVYGGSPGSIAGTANDVKGYDREEGVNTMEGFRAFHDIIQRKNIIAQTDNIEAMEAVNKQEASRKAVQTQVEAQNLKDKKFSYDLQKQLRDNSVEAAQAASKEAMHKADLVGIQAKTASQTQKANIRRIQDEAKFAFEKLQGQKLANKIQEIERKMRDKGFTKDDNIIFRMAAQTMTREELIKFVNEHKGTWRKFLDKFSYKPLK